MDPGPGHQRVRSHRVRTRNQQRGGSVRQLRRHGGREPAAGDEGGKRPDLVEVRLARTFVVSSVSECHDLLDEPSLGPGSERALVRFDRVRFHVVAGDVPLLGDHLRAAELRHLLGAVTRLPSRGPAERVGEAVLLAGEHGGADRDRAHVLHAAGDDEIGRSRHHRLRGEMNGLLRRSALPVDRRSRHLVGHPGDEPACARDVAGLRTDGVDAAEDHVVDRRGIDVDTIEQRADGMRAEIGRVDVRERPVALPDRGAHRIDDVGLVHLGHAKGSPHRSCCDGVGRRPSSGRAPTRVSDRDEGRTRLCIRWHRGIAARPGPSPARPRRPCISPCWRVRDRVSRRRGRRADGRTPGRSVHSQGGA